VSSLKERLLARALELGFARFGVAKAEPLEAEAPYFRAFLAAGRHGEMGYLEETADVRLDPTHEGMIGNAASIIMLATPYARADGPVGPAPGRVARYAQGRDYHNALQKRANRLAVILRREGHAARAAVDTLPLLERAWAQRAGLGFIGKNCCLIVPGVGSHVLLSAVVTTAVLEPDAPIRERCGACTLCLDACPTRAFVGPREMDARRCISYLTIEKEGSIPAEMRAQIGDWMLGCDVCQDVCPYNAAKLPEPTRTERFAPAARWQERSAEDLLRIDSAAFDAYAESSAVKRPGRVGMARNAAVVLGNRGEKRHLPVLDQTAREHDSDVVREAAAWAAQQIRGREQDA